GGKAPPPPPRSPPPPVDGPPPPPPDAPAAPARIRPEPGLNLAAQLAGRAVGELLGSERPLDPRRELAHDFRETGNGPITSAPWVYPSHHTACFKSAAHRLSLLSPLTRYR